MSDLESKAQEFGTELADLLNGTLPEVPPVDVVRQGDAFHVQPSAPEGAVPLLVSGDRMASLIVKIRCRLDSKGQYLAVQSSRFELKADLDRTPVLRFDFDRDMIRVPCAHVQVHAHRGALSHLLSRTGHRAPHDMASLHIPVGGARFRPGLEDVLQFLIEECQFDHKEDWRRHVEAGRATWRRRQLASAIRDAPSEAVRVLRDLGYEVTPSADGDGSHSEKFLTRW